MKSAPNKYTKEVEDAFNRLSIKNGLSSNTKLQNYLGTKLKVYGFDAKTQHELCKKGFSFYTEDKEGNFRLFDQVYHTSNSHEGKNQAFIYLDRNYKYISPDLQLSILPHWVSQIDNWAHSDYLSKFLTRLLENSITNKVMMSHIKGWNKSENLWERRQSMVSLYYYSRTKKQHIPFEVSSKLVLNLMEDKEYYVQKALGWTLRESYNLYPQETYNFVKKYIKNIRPVAFATCLEKMSESQKAVLKQKRK